MHRLRKEFGHTKDIWGWSGYTWEELQKESADKQELLHNLDILVDGRFLLAKKDLTLQFRGVPTSGSSTSRSRWPRVRLLSGTSWFIN